MENLFNSLEMDEMVVENKPTSLKISTKKGSPLTNEQRTFNNLISQIELLQKNIETKGENLRNIQAHYSKTITPIDKSLANVQIKLAKEIALITKNVKFGKRQLEDITEVILDLCDQAFKKIEPDALAEKFYNEWSDLTYKEEIELEGAELKEMLSQEMKYNMGIDIDFNEYGNTPEEFARLKARLMAEIEKKELDKETFNSNRKKTKKQIENEKKQNEKEISKIKNIRAIYISLAKVLHPDTETDEIKKLEKEVLMKKVTSAYGANDLPALLKLELEWVATEKNNIETISAEKLKIYIQSLKEQVGELQTELYSLNKNPAYQAISYFSTNSQEKAEKEINLLATRLKSMTNEYKKNIEVLKQGGNKKDFINYIDYYLEINSF